MSLIRRLLRTAAWTLGILLGIPVLAYLALVAFNLGEEPLRPEVAAYLEPAPVALAPERNAYFAFLGLLAPEGADPHAAGLKRIAGYERGAGLSAAGDVAFEVPAGLKLCQRDTACLPLAAANAGAIRGLEKRYAFVLARLHALDAYPAYAETRGVRADNLLDFGPGHSGVFQLARSVSALRASEGDLAGAIGEIERRVCFVRKERAGSRWLVESMLANARLTDEFALLAEILAAHPAAAREHAEAIARMLAPMRDEERDRLRWARTEFRYAATMLSSREHQAATAMSVWFLGLWFPDDLRLRLYERAFADGAPKWWLRAAGMALRPLLDPSQTLNLMYDRNRAYFDLPRGDARQFAAAFREKAAAEGPRHAALPRFSLKNPVGLGALRVAGPFEELYGDYLWRDVDTERLLALAASAARIAERRIDAGGIEAFLAGAEALRDPLTGEPFRWDPGRRQIYFESARRLTTEYTVVGGVKGRMGLRVSAA